eukprot:scaffold2385_cov178-Amphora_coffeaeformis.AAC.7
MLNSIPFSSPCKGENASRQHKTATSRSYDKDRNNEKKDCFKKPGDHVNAYEAGEHCIHRKCDHVPYHIMLEPM